MNKEETSAKSATIVDFDGTKDGEFGVITGNNSKKSFKFDRVYTPKDGQGSVICHGQVRSLSIMITLIINKVSFLILQLMSLPMLLLWLFLC